MNHARVDETAAARLDFVHLLADAHAHPPLQQQKNLQLAVPVGGHDVRDKIMHIAVVGCQIKQRHNVVAHLHAVHVGVQALSVLNHVFAFLSLLYQYRP